MTDNVFDKARQVLRERGWTQGEGEDPRGRVCLLGAVAVAKGMDADAWSMLCGSNASPSDASSEADLLADVIGEQYGPLVFANRSHWPFAWNDQRGRTQADLDSILDKCARITDERVEP